MASPDKPPDTQDPTETLIKRVINAIGLIISSADPLGPLDPALRDKEDENDKKVIREERTRETSEGEVSKRTSTAKATHKQNTSTSSDNPDNPNNPHSQDTHSPPAMVPGFNTKVFLELMRIRTERDQDISYLLNHHDTHGAHDAHAKKSDQGASQKEEDTVKIKPTKPK